MTTASPMPHVMILAAGRGTRLKELTENTPKPLVPVAGVPPLVRTFGLLSRAGYGDVVVNACYLADQIDAAAEAARRTHGLAVHVSHEVAMLETGGGITNALPLLGDAPFVAINGDLVWGEEDTPILPELPQLFDATQMDALLVLVPKAAAPTHQGAGDFSMDAAGRLTHRGPASTAPFIYTGIQMLHPRLFKDAPQGSWKLVDAYHQAAARGRLFGVLYHGPWVDMGTPAGMEAAAALLAPGAQAAAG